MAKAKKEKAPSSSSADPDEKLILNYLNTQNRPYSAIDVFNNLHGAVGKTAVVKILNTLAERGEITVKTFGKSQLYVARQDLLPVPSSEELNALDDEINQLKENLMKEKEAHRQVQAKLAMMNSSLPTEEVKARIALLEGEVGEMHARLEPLERGTVKIDPEERIRVEKQYALYLKSYKERKKLCTEIVGMLSESMGKRPAEIFEEMGLETDPAPIPIIN